MGDKSRTDYYTLARLGQLSNNLNKNKVLVTQEDIDIRKEVFRLQGEAKKLLGRHRKLQRDRIAERRRIRVLAEHLRAEYTRKETEYNAIPAARRRAPSNGCDGDRTAYLDKWLINARHVLRYADEMAALLDQQITVCALKRTVDSDDDRDSSSGTSDSDSDSGADAEGDAEGNAQGASYLGSLVSSMAGAVSGGTTKCPCACDPCLCIEKHGACHCPKPTSKLPPQHQQQQQRTQKKKMKKPRVPREGYEYPRADEIGGGVLTGRRQRRRSRVGKLDANGGLERLAAQLRHSRTKLRTLCENDYLVCIRGKFYDLRDVDPCMLECFISKA